MCRVVQCLRVSLCALCKLSALCNRFGLVQAVQSVRAVQSDAEAGCGVQMFDGDQVAGCVSVRIWRVP